MKEQFPEIVKNRRSIRSFNGEHIPDETIREILSLAAYAPSSWGRHPVEFIVIRDRKVMAELARCKQMGAGPLAHGDAAIVPIIDKRNLELWVEDAAVASTYILLAAEYCGVAACWIHMKDRRGHTNMAEEDIRDLLGIPSHYGILNAVSLGMPKRPNEPRKLSAKIHYEIYGGISMDTVKGKVQALISASSCCAELKKVGQDWLDAVGTDKESTATQKLLAEIENDIMPIDGMIRFAESERCLQMFGEKGAADMLAHGKEIKAQGAVYCDCPACVYALEVKNLLQQQN